MTSTQAAPTSLLRRSIRRAFLMILPLVALASVWAFRPITRTPIDAEISEGSAHKIQPKTARATVDPEAFAALLWSPPPVFAKAAPPKPPPPLPSLKLQLIGIMKETATDATPSSAAVLRAALYDPDTDTLHIVAAGERVGTGRFTVSKLTPDTVELADGRERRTLSLRTDAPPSTP